MGFSLEVPDEEKVKAEISRETKVVSEESLRIRRQAEENAAAVINCDMDSLAVQKQLTGSIEQLGAETIRRSAQKNMLLQVSLGNLSQTGGEGGEVSRGLMELNRAIKGLDPSLVDFTKQGIFGKLFNPVRAYFEKYEKADTTIVKIIEALDQGKKKLQDDNTTLAIEQQSLRDLSKKLNKEITMAVAMDEFIAAKIEAVRAQEPALDKIRFIEEEILFPLRQRIMDMQQMIIINQQGIMAMEVVQRNNKELMRGVERAKTVTLTALRTAVMVAGALYNQKVVLQKVQLVNETTNNMIAATARMLKEQGGEIHKQAMEANISVEVLKSAFADVTEAFDQISAFKQQALPAMQVTIDQFRELAAQGEAAIRRIEKSGWLAE